MVQVPLVNDLASLLPGLGVGALMTLIGIALYAKLVKLTAPNATRKALQEGRNAEKALGWRRFVIDAQGVHNIAENFSVNYLWKGIDKVATTDEHVFLYITTANAFIVPLRAFADARAFDAFVESARRFHGLAGVGEVVREVLGTREPRERRGAAGARLPDASLPVEGITPKRRLPE